MQLLNDIDTGVVAIRQRVYGYEMKELQPTTKATSWCDPFISWKVFWQGYGQTEVTVTEVKNVNVFLLITDDTQ